MAVEIPKLVTIPNVPLAKTGTYQLGSGETTFTEEDLQYAVAALNAPGVRNPILKFGHEEEQLTQQPAVGRVTNLVYDQASQTLFGDYVGVPEWLANVMPVAYPDRSIEAWRNIEIQGRKHLFVITAVSLLGEDAPGVDTLEDLYALFYPEGEQIAADSGAAQVAVIIKGGGQVADKVVASVEVADITRAYYEGVGWEWWIRSVRLDPNELIVDNDDEGKLYRVPFEIEGEEVTFGDPIEVKIRYEDVAASLAATGAPLAVFANRAESRPDAPSKPKEDDIVAMSDDQFLEELRKKHGLADDASREDILSAIGGDTPPKDPEQPEGETAPEPTVETAPEPEPATAKKVQVPEGMVLVDQSQWEQVKAGAEAGAQVAVQAARQHRESKLEAAIQKGKFPRSRKAHYETAWKGDPKGTEELIDAMAEGLVPVEMLASAEQGDGAGGGEAYPAEWLPEIKARRELAERMPAGVVIPGTVIREEV